MLDLLPRGRTPIAPPLGSRRARLGQLWYDVRHLGGRPIPQTPFQTPPGAMPFYDNTGDQTDRGGTLLVEQNQRADQYEATSHETMQRLIETQILPRTDVEYKVIERNQERVGALVRKLNQLKNMDNLQSQEKIAALELLNRILILRINLAQLERDAPVPAGQHTLGKFTIIDKTNLNWLLHERQTTYTSPSTPKGTTVTEQIFSLQNAGGELTTFAVPNGVYKNGITLENPAANIRETFYPKSSMDGSIDGAIVVRERIR